MYDTTRAQYERQLEKQHNEIKRLEQACDDLDTVTDIMDEMMCEFEEFEAKARALIERYRNVNV